MKNSALLIASSLAVLCSVKAATIAIGDTLVPSGLGVGDTFHLVFVTSSTRNGTSSDIADYNTFVTNSANSAGSLVAGKGWTWRAIASTPTVDARDNASVSAAVYNLNDDLISTGFADIWDGSIGNAIGFNQLGVGSGNARVWTGTTTGGIAQISGSNPAANNRSLGGNAGFPAYGFSGQTGSTNPSGWITNAGNFANQTSNYALYGLSEKLTVIPEPSAVLLGGLGLLALLRRRR